MHVLLAIPTLSGAVDATVLVLALGFGKSRPDAALSLLTVRQISPVELARNAIAQRALTDPTITHVWMIDEDIIVPPNAPDLLEVDADIVTARCTVLVRERGARSLRLVVPAGTKSPDRDDAFDMSFGEAREPVEVDACGAGCVLIRRAVLEDARMKAAADVPGEPAALFRSVRRPNGITLVGEDLDFTWRARRLGYRIVLEPRVRCGHRKLMDLLELEGLSDVAE